MEDIWFGNLGKFTFLIYLSLKHSIFKKNYFQSAGGLVTAVAPVVIRCGGLWVGWPGTFPTKDEEGNVVENIPESEESEGTPAAGLLSKQVGYCVKRIERELSF